MQNDPDSMDRSAETSDPTCKTSTTTNPLDPCIYMQLAKASFCLTMAIYKILISVIIPEVNKRTLAKLSLLHILKNNGLNGAL